MATWKDDIQTALDELDVTNNSRPPLNPETKGLNNEIFETREIDWDLFRAYKDTLTKEQITKNKNHFLNAQRFESKLNFYREENMIFTNFTEDLIDSLTDKIVSAKMFYVKGNKKELATSEDFISENQKKQIIKNLLKYGKIAVLSYNTSAIRNDVVTDDGNVLENPIGEKLGGIEILKPLSYFKNEKGEIKKRAKFNKKGKLIFTKIEAKHVFELSIGSPILFNKRDLGYAYDKTFTNHIEEIELGKTRLHVDERYGTDLDSSRYQLYRPIHSDGVNEIAPLFESTQTSARPSEYQKSLQIIGDEMCREIGTKYEDFAYLTAKQTGTVSMSQINKVNGILRTIADQLNTIISGLFSNVRVEFEDFNLDTNQEKLAALVQLQNFITPEDRTNMAYNLLGIEYDKTKIEEFLNGEDTKSSGSIAEPNTTDTGDSDNSTKDNADTD